MSKNIIWVWEEVTPWSMLDGPDDEVCPHGRVYAGRTKKEATAQMRASQEGGYFLPTKYEAIRNK